MNIEEMVEKRTARDILSMIENICFSEKYRRYRWDYGTRRLIIDSIKNRYNVG